MATAIPDVWQETYLFSIQEKGGTAYQYAGVTEDITGMDFGDKDIEGVALANGGRIAKHTPQGDESVTVKAYPVDADYTTGKGFVQLFHPQSTMDSTDPISVSNTRLRDKFQLVFLWCSALPATAGAATGTGNPAYRVTAKNAYLTSYKPSTDDKVLSAEVTFKWTPFDNDGTSNKTEESTGSASNELAAVADFT